MKKEFDQYEMTNNLKLSNWYKGCMLAFRDNQYNFTTHDYDPIKMSARPYEFVYLALKAKL